MYNELGQNASGESNSQSAIVGIVIGCLTGVALLVVGAICLYKWIFRAVKMRRSIDKPLDLDDESGNAGAQKRQEALKHILDRGRF
jgi:hypothetical protein